MHTGDKLMAVIDLENMEFFARHGCYQLEKKAGNRFRVDISIIYDATEAASADDVGLSVNYLEAYRVVRKQMDQTSDIIENVAKRIAEALRATFPAIEKTTVRVSKLAPPLGGKIEKVTVTVSL